MERKNRSNRKKCSIGNNMLSLILVLAMVFTNVQPSLMTVQAAESETAVIDETSASGETAQADDGQKTESSENSQTENYETGNDETGNIEDTRETAETSETVKPDETEETGETVNPSETEETGETVKPDETEETSETTKPTETEEAGETTEPTETEGETEIVEPSTETEETTETVETETETEAAAEEIAADAEETVTVKAHFKNVTGWEKVALHHWGGGIEGTTWPGIEVTEKDQDGYYVIEIPNVAKTGDELGIIFNNNNNGAQTADIKIPASEFTADIYELWAWVDEAGKTGWSAAPIVSPEIEKNTVTFRYKGDSAETVLLAGTMNNWTADAESENAISLVKGEDGIFTYTTKLQRGDYEYKFVVDGGWTADPNNSDKADGGNSIFSLSTLLSPEINGYDATFYYESDVETVLVAGSMNSWNENPESEDAAVMTRNADGILTYTFTGLLPGDYTYKFIEIVDGEKIWITDPNNDLIADDGFGGKNSFFTIGEDTSKTYEYTIHYYNPSVSDPVLEGPDLLIWNGNASNSSGKAYLFEKITEDKENGINWLTLTAKVPYKNIGMNGRLRAGKTGSKIDADRKYAITGDAETAELWYVYGKGIYDEKPAFGKVAKVEASLLSGSMNYTQNNVLTLQLKDENDEKVTGRIREAYVDASDLGMSSKMAIDVELLEITLSVQESVSTGKYTLPVTVVDFYNNTVETSVEVEVTSKDSDDFDWDEAVIYFMVTDRFYDGNESNNTANNTGDTKTYGENAGLYHGGDFAGVTAKLDYLKELGINTIWITPIVDNIAGVVVGDGTGDVPFNASYHGYWASDFTKLDPSLGTEDEFKALIEQAHSKGIKIMVDVVLNHAGYETEDYFNSLLKDEDGNAIQMIRDDSQMVSGSDIQTSLSGLPDFLTENEAVRNQLVKWQVDWMTNYAIDYFRVDTVKHVESTTWSAFKNELTKENPNFKMIGEYFGAGHSWNEGSLGSGQMDSVLDFNFNEYATDFVKGNISSVESNLQDRNRTLNNTYMTGQFLSSHDEVGFKQNLLDQKWEKEAADAAALVAATLQITAKGQPVIYYGEEIGQTGENNYPYQTNRYDFSWTEADIQMADKNSVYSHYSTLLKIRNQYADIFAKGDRQSVVMSDADGYDVISRSYNGETIYIGMNIMSEEQTISIPVNSGGVSGYDDLYSITKNGARAAAYQVVDGKIEVTIPAAKDGGTVILVPTDFSEGLIAPDLMVIKGRESKLPAQLVRMSSDGTRENVDVTYSMKQAVDGVTLDDANKTIKVEESCEAGTITLTANAGNDTIDFTVKVYTDNNTITLKIHYHRSDEDYDGWNIWGWKTGAGGEGYEFEDENGEKVVTIELDDARANSDYNYIVRKRVGDNDWAEQGPDQKIDLSEVLSGTVHFYIEAGKNGGTRVFDDDVLTGAKIVSVEYDSESGHIIVKTKIPVTGNAKDVFALKSSTGDLTIKKVNVNNNVYEIITVEDLTTLEAKSMAYTLVFDGYEYAVRMPSAYSTEEFEDLYTYEGNDLGATWTSEKTTFKVWAPTADSVLVNLYKSGTKGTNDLIETIEMTKGEKGVWAAEKEGDLNGTYYTYSVTIGSKTTEACDPYAVTTGVNGDRAMVLDLSSTDPTGWSQDSGSKINSYTDAVIYELQVRDFSIDESSGIENKGKFLGLTEKGTKNPSGETTGLDYLIDLGVTHLHLLPSYDYATVDETRLNEPQYNWGYDPKNYNVPEGSYSTNPYKGDVRVKEMKQMVKTLHDNDINVIMDVVYNHVYSADDFCFNQIVPQYFSRTNEDGSYSNGSGCGNDTASERAMVKKYIVDSVNYWADEYHIDGFRFDLVGLLDTETINEVVETVHAKHPNVIFYGEGWDMSTTVTKDGYTMATQKNSEQTPGFAYFSDTMRDLLKGSVFDANSIGFISGAEGREEDVAKNFTATPGWSSNPTQIVNYVSCHDNYTLKDKLNVSRKDASEEDRIKMNNLAAAIYMTSEGIPLIHAGEEILRTKVDESGNIIHNSYNSSDFVNSIKWSDLDKEEYRDVRDYYKGLIAFRKNHAALRLSSNADVAKSVTSYSNISKNMVMFVIKGNGTVAGEVSDEIIIIFNADAEEKEIDLYDEAYGIIQGDWNVCINDKQAGIETLATITDGKAKVAPISALVLVKGEKQSDDNSVYDNAEKNRTALEKLIEECEALQESDYAADCWADLQTALKSAKECAENSDATAEELNAARKNLLEAYEALVAPGIRIEWASNSGLTYREDGLRHTVYTGTAIKPAIKVYNGKTLLQEKTHYTVSYKNNTKAGTATVTVKGKGNYKETASINFAIDKLDVSGLAIDDLYQLVSAGSSSPAKLKPTVKYNGKTLKQGKDYQATCDEPVLGSKSLVVRDVVITGIGENFTGSKTIHLTLADKSQFVLMSSVKIQKIPDMDYQNGDKVVPSNLTVTYKGKALAAEDYSVTYSNNTEAGATATVTVKGTGKKYIGVKTAAFKIKGQVIKAKDVTLNGLTSGGLVYAGKALEPAVTVNGANAEQYEVTYQNNTNVGKATVIVTGKNGYSGTVKKTFKIMPYNLSGSQFVYGTDGTNEIQNQIPYAKGGSKLDSSELKAGFKVKSNAGDTFIKTLSLEEGKDYALSYKNNKAPGSATATIKGKGNYTGTQTVSFTIKKQDISNLTDIAAADIIVKKASQYDKVVPVIKDLDGKALKNKTDFKVDGYVYDDDSAISGVPAKGSRIKVKISAQGNNYEGAAYATFRVIADESDISKASVTVKPQIYTGREIVPALDDITVVIKVNGTSNTLNKETDYEIVGCTKNISKGTAKVTIHGTGEYGGTKTVSFKIQQLSFEGAANMLSLLQELFN